MSSDWDAPRDKRPLTDDTGRHQKKGGSKKPFILEWRYIGPDRVWFIKSDREWSIYSRYKTEKARDQAFKAVTHRQKSSHLYYANWEYRIP